MAFSRVPGLIARRLFLSVKIVKLLTTSNKSNNFKVNTSKPVMGATIYYVSFSSVKSTQYPEIGFLFFFFFLLIYIFMSISNCI